MNHINLDADLLVASSEGEQDMTRLRRDLAARAETEGVLDIAYRTLDSPIGVLVLAASDRGLIRIALPTVDHELTLTTLAEKVSPRILEAPARLDPVARELDEYFAGRRTDFDLPLDLRLAAGFRREVLNHLPEVVYGNTASYAELAALAGRPKAIRAAASACATNPIPLVVPCHRVVRSDGSIGQYLGGPEVKRFLLDLEFGRFGQ